MESTLQEIHSGKYIAKDCRGGIQLNERRIDSYRIFRIIFTFRINRIINFRIESNEFRTNPASEKFDSNL